MAVTDSHYKMLIVQKVNDTATGPVSTNIDILWAMYADKALIKHAPRLQYFYALKEAIGMMMSFLREQMVEWRVDGVIEKNDMQLTNLKGLLTETDAEIEKIEKQARLVRTPLTGTLTTVEPISPASDPATAQAPDPNDRRYRGDPLLPPFTRRVI